VGEALHRAGLAFPLNAQGHYVAANHVPSQSRYFQQVASLDDARPGDVISIQRRNDAGHLEIVTGVDRDPSGHVVSISSVAAHRDGVFEGVGVAAPLVRAAAAHGGVATATVGNETFRVLRPLAPPSPNGAAP
jgi:hypothetical protein